MNDNGLFELKLKKTRKEGGGGSGKSELRERFRADTCRSPSTEKKITDPPQKKTELDFDKFFPMNHPPGTRGRDHLPDNEPYFSKHVID